jgi:hypothetical protein
LTAPIHIAKSIPPKIRACFVGRIWIASFTA